MQRPRPNAVLLFGPPGVGKGTQGHLLGGIPGYKHVSTGEMFRSMDENTPLGRKVRSYTKDGNFVPDALTIQIFRAHIEDYIDTGAFDPAEQLLILDGIPRNAVQVEMITADMNVLKLVHLVCRDEERMIERIRLRAEREHRADDAREEVVRHRFDVYREQSAPVLNCYTSDMIVDVHADAEPAEVLYDILSLLNPIRRTAFYAETN